jgi:hypothetical protein
MRFFWVACLLALAACGPAIVVYTPPQSASGRLCVAHCGDAHYACHTDCELGNRQCLNRAQAQALIDYERYTGEAFLHDEPVDFTPQDFERLGPCREGLSSCMAACEPTYQACYEKCGGEVETE